MPKILCKEYHVVLWKEISLMLSMKYHNWYARNIEQYFEKKYLQYFQWNVTNAMQEILCNTFKEISSIISIKCPQYYARNIM